MSEKKRPWHVNFLTLFPEIFPGPLGHSLARKGLEKEIWSYTVVDIRDYAEAKTGIVDDRPYGGGPGMVIRPDVVENALRSLRHPGRPIYMSPRGLPLDQEIIEGFVKHESITLLCGRYEGVDQRALDACGFEEISIGDYILNGGEVAAIALVECCLRLLPGFLGNEDTPGDESFSKGLLEHPQYTRPAEWRSHDGELRKVPDVLMSGNHAAIAKWREEESIKITAESRPDMFINAIQNLPVEDDDYDDDEEE